MSEDFQCSFCHRYHYEVLNLIASPEAGIYICSQCIEDFHPTPPEDVLYHPIKKKKKKSYSFFDIIENFFDSDNHILDPECSFCQRYYPLPTYLITNNNNTAFICNRCMQVCKNVINERIDDLPNFISYWEQELTTPEDTDFSYPKQKHLLEKIEYWLDFKPSEAQKFIPLLDMMLNLNDISEKIVKRIDLIKSEIAQIDDTISTELD